MCAQGGMSLVAFETGEEDNMIKRHLINIPGTCIIKLLDLLPNGLKEKNLLFQIHLTELIFAYHGAGQFLSFLLRPLGGGDWGLRSKCNNECNN